jgi:AraC-like DNA-binding protein
MPLRFDVEEYLGTNSDGSRSDEFCYYCLKDGHYTVDISMQETVDIWVKYTDKYNEYSGTHYTRESLRVTLNKRLPTLNRWRQKQETQCIHYHTIQKVKSYLNDRLFEKLDMKALISMSGLSKFHLRRVFQSVTGENIASYMQRLRLEQIAHLLISTDATLEQIVRQTNYETKFSLAKAFRKHFGMPT